MRFPNGRSAPNRVWLAPMTNLQSHDDGSISEAEVAWLKARSRGGFGVIESCATHVHPDGHAWKGQLGCFDDTLMPGWTQLADTIHEDSALLLAQLFHGGERASLSADPWSCNPSDDGRVRAGSEQDIERVIEDFGQAALRLQKAGVDGVELHGAHGYLLCQFLSLHNQREDQWGGSLENRARLLLRVFERVKELVSPDFIVGVRLSPEDFKATKGLDIDESIQTALWLSARRVDFIHISLWDANANSQKYPDKHPCSLFRTALPPEVPLISAGNIWSAADFEGQLALGADAVALGRSAIANADWPIRVLQNAEEPRRPPMSPAELAEQALSPPFIEYMKRWPGFVQD